MFCMLILDWIIFLETILETLSLNHRDFTWSRSIAVSQKSLLLCVCDSGEVYTWGDNDEGQLGDGTTNAIQRPRLVAALQGKKINRVACGSAHTLAWSTSKPTNAGKLPAQVLAQLLEAVMSKNWTGFKPGRPLFLNKYVG